ncbi:MAG TPA: protein-disulfide reductase DsbD domain-containing protein [Micropepsaceae bacterium]|nr:protein-disulfide reductase DsbD domain-containing protein [Micropepsaceae bacterium]
MKRSVVLSLVAGLALLGPAGPSLAQSGLPPDNQPKVKATLIPEHPAIAPGQTVTVALREEIRDKWHTYWINPGDAGAPTSLDWQLSDGWKAGAIQWPYPVQLPVGPLMDFGYEKEVALLVDVTAPKDAKPGETAKLNAHAMWLVCSDVCVPEDQEVSLSLPIAADVPPADPKTQSYFTDARAKLPHASPWKAVYDAGDKRFALLVQAPELVKARPKEAIFYPYTDGYLEGAVPQKAGTAADGLVIETATGFKLKTQAKRAGVDKVGGVLVLTGSDDRVDALEVAATAGTVPQSAVLLANAPDIGFAEAVLFAFLGGLILNLMPCVFPVLSMKALALAGKAAAPEKAKLSAVAYGAGVLASFAVLGAVLVALKGTGTAIGWGFQLQQPAFVLALALLMFAVALNLSGLYEVGGANLAGVGQKLAGKEGALGSFFTGVLAVLVATPCTAPFMAAGLGFALAASAPAALAVFLALGAGFSLPFVLLGFSPGALRRLPKPGTWMETLRQALAFPMYGAAAWLVWVLSQQAGSDGVLLTLGSGLVLAFGLWLYGRSQEAEGRRRVAGYAAAALAIVGAVALIPLAGLAPTQTQTTVAETGALGYEPYSAARLAALRAEGRPVFVNATAAWCITCLVNEKVALSGDAVARAFQEKKVAALKADWTNQDSEITALLASQGRSGVPLYLYFRPGSETPLVLPQILTESSVIAAMGPAS